MNNLLKQINNNTKEYLTESDYQNILKTYAELYNKSQSNEEIEYNLSLANQASKMKLDADTIITCLLFNLNKKNIETKFNTNILNLLKELDNINKIEEKILTNTKRERSAENKRNLLIAMSQDHRVLIIKIIDTLKRLEKIHLEKNSTKKYIESIHAIKVYAPLAYRLGFEGICSQIEKLSFPHAYPKQYKLTKRFLGDKYEKLEKELIKAKQEIEVFLNKNNLQFNSIEFRRKQFYSI
ncbi:MAG: HD domain-containing protein [Candidatus Pacebacteria bacterium]|nr:HD domain-containing protein [Candidatus Paceibacterota bacterium]